MKKNEFRTPLIQSAAVLGGVLLLFAIVASSGASGSGGGVVSVIFGIGNLILFFVGLGVALLISIALLIAIFLGCVAMVDAEQARSMYADLKKNFSANALSLNKQCSEYSGSGPDLSQEEYDRMKQEIAQLHDNNTGLHENIKNISDDNALLQTNVTSLEKENSTLMEKIEELSTAVENLQNSENTIKELVDDLNQKIQEGVDPDLKSQVGKLEQLQAETQKEIAGLIERLNSLEAGLKQAPTSGIFSYIEQDSDQKLFMQKAEEAVAKGMTYAQIDDFLTENLPQELDTIIKDHPALTKKYIRNLRRE